MLVGRSRNIIRLIAHSDLTLFLPDRDRKLYRAVLETKGEFPDIMTVLSLSEWYPGHPDDYDSKYELQSIT